MKFGLKLTTVDKIGLAVGSVVVWTIGLIPSAIGGGVLYHYREQVRAFLIKKAVKQKIDNLISKFKG